MPNPTGTAPGFILQKDGVTVIAFPGPPAEMHPMWEQTVGPYLAARSGETIHSLTLRFCGIGEAALEQELADLIAAQANPTIAPYAKLAEVHIRVTAKAKTVADAQTLIAPVEAEIRRRTGHYLYGVDDETLELVVGRLLRERGMTLAVAESCTGGLLGGRITAIPGSSDYFLGGVISYSNALKQSLLGVPAGYAGRPWRGERGDGLCLGCRRATRHRCRSRHRYHRHRRPGGATEEKPVGLVYIGAAYKDDVKAFRHLLWGNRELIRARAVQQALVLLRDKLT